MTHGQQYCNIVNTLFCKKNHPCLKMSASLCQIHEVCPLSRLYASSGGTSPPPHFVAWGKGGRFFGSGQDSVPLQLPSRPEGSPILVSKLIGRCARHTWATQPYRCCHPSLTGRCARHTWATQPYRCCHLSLTGHCAGHTWAASPTGVAT
jgi:hypothetical protein